jgi:ankyrin repeat protein
MVVGLLKHDTLDVNLQTNGGLTALMVASRDGNTDIVVELLKHDKVNVNQQCQDGATALLWAIQHGHVDIVVAVVETRQGGCQSSNQC